MIPSIHPSISEIRVGGFVNTLILTESKSFNKSGERCAYSERLFFLVCPSTYAWKGGKRLGDVDS